eukprot:3831695-Amphidinium_carterae.1
MRRRAISTEFQKELKPVGIKTMSQRLLVMDWLKAFGFSSTPPQSNTAVDSWKKRCHRAALRGTNLEFQHSLPKLLAMQAYHKYLALLCLLHPSHSCWSQGKRRSITLGVEHIPKRTCL